MITKVPFKVEGPWSKRSIFMAHAGSHAYGTNTPESDIDLRGVFLAEPEHLVGLSNVEAYTEETPNDLQCYELRHFVKLCLKGSPLQLEMLFYDDDVVVSKDTPGLTYSVWDKLISIRRSFLGKHLKATLGGFARGDIQRIVGNSTAKSGAKGKVLIERYGYNTKHASNAWRLLKMAEILFTTGNLVVRLPEKDRQEIVEIKNGKFRRDEFLAFIENEDKRIFDLAEQCNLPAKSDFNLAEETVMDIYTDLIKTI